MAANRALAEFVGTFALVFAGCGAIVVDQAYGGLLGHVGVSMVFGLVVMAMIYALGSISGAHINPAVTIALVFAGRLYPRVAGSYLVSQCAGAITAAFLLRLLFPDDPTLGATAPVGSMAQSFLLEIVLSFLLMLVILSVSTGHEEKGIMAGVAIGGTVALGALLGGPVSGASMNPARSLGPALVSGEMTVLWIYLLAPVIGTVLAYPSCRLIQGGECCGGPAREASG
jgi:MIP family channel proteins